MTLNALRDMNINAAIRASNGNLFACCGRDVNVNAPMTTTNGSILLNAGQDVNVSSYHDNRRQYRAVRKADIHINAKMTLTRGSTIPARDWLASQSYADSRIFGTRVPGRRRDIDFCSARCGDDGHRRGGNDRLRSRLYFGTNRFLDQVRPHRRRRFDPADVLFTDANKLFDRTPSAVLSDLTPPPHRACRTGYTLVARPNATAAFDGGRRQRRRDRLRGYTLGGANADQYALSGPAASRPSELVGLDRRHTDPTPTPTPTPTQPPG